MDEKIVTLKDAAVQWQLLAETLRVVRVKRGAEGKSLRRGFDSRRSADRILDSV